MTQRKTVSKCKNEGNSKKFRVKHTTPAFFQQVYFHSKSKQEAR